MQRLIGRPSPAMVVALIALVAATCGTAIADGVTAVAAKLKKGEVTTREIKDGTVRLADIRKSDRAKLKGATGARGAAGAQGPAGPAGPAGPQGPAGTPDGYTKAEADGKFLAANGKAVDADKLDGTDSSGFVKGQGAVNYGLRNMNEGAATTNLITVPGVGTIKADCGNTGSNPDASISFLNQSGRTGQLVSEFRTGVDESDLLNADDTVTDNSEVQFLSHSLNAASGVAKWTYQFSSGAGLLLTGSDIVTFTVTAILTGNQCRYSGHAVASSTDPITFVIG